MMKLLSVALLLWIPFQNCIIVQSSNKGCEDGDVRLSGGRHYREGRVEVCRNQQWGRVCNDQWDENESAVVCRQLGFSEDGTILLESGHFNDADENSLPFLLDDLGCTGSESNLLECLPKHNCKRRTDENVDLICFHNGVKLELDTDEQYNNTLITEDNIGEGQKALFCLTDRTECCINEFGGSWFLPNGSRVLATSHEQFYVTWGNQTIGLNCAYCQNSSLKLSPGIYHCEMMDKNNVTHYLYTGIYPEDEGYLRIMSLGYNKMTQTIICISTGGPATHVVWSKDDVNIRTASNEDLYEDSQIIINTTSATYENRLRIVDKSSEAAGNYTCQVTNTRGGMNGSLYIQVCRDLELRINNKSDIQGSTVEMCIDDQWHEAKRSMLLENYSPPLQDISVMIVDSNSVMLKWSRQQSNIPNIISGYDFSCTTSSLSDHGQIHEVRVPNISTSTTRVQVNGLLPGTAYQCCINAHIQTNTPLDLISSNCIATSTTKSEQVSSCGDSFDSELAAGLGAGLGLLLVVVCVGSILINMFLIKRLLKEKDRGTNLKVLTNRVLDEDDSDHDERLVGNPIYGDSLPGASENTENTERESYDVLHHNVGAVQLQQGVIPMGAYETISNLPNRASSNGGSAMPQGDDASAYAKLGAEGITVGEIENTDEGVNAGVELRSPYANIF